MYNLDTVLLAYQHDGVAEEERFASQFGLRASIIQETGKLPFLDGKLKSHLRTVQTRDTRIPAIVKGSISPVTTMSYNLELNLPETDYTTVTLNTLMVSYGMYPEDWVNQHVSPEQIERNRVKECDEALALAFEALVYTHYNTYKTQVWSGANATLGYDFDNASKNLQVSWDAQSKSTMFSHLQTMGEYNNWGAQTPIFVANPLAGFLYNVVAQSGVNNAVNLNNSQSFPQKFTSNRVSITSGMGWSGFLIESGSVGVAQNFTLPFQIAKQVQGGKFGISDGVMPMLGMPVGVYAEEGIKASSQNGNMSWVDKRAFIVSFFLLKKYNSAPTTTVTNILKIDGIV
jgi:hypothetical protein